jgi:hypothetical protein
MPKELIVKLKKEQMEDGTISITPDYTFQPEDAYLEVKDVDYDNMICRIIVYLKTDIKVV